MVVLERGVSGCYYGFLSVMELVLGVLMGWIMVYFTYDACYDTFLVVIFMRQDGGMYGRRVGPEVFLQIQSSDQHLECTCNSMSIDVHDNSRMRWWCYMPSGLW